MRGQDVWILFCFLWRVPRLLLSSRAHSTIVALRIEKISCFIPSLVCLSALAGAGMAQGVEVRPTGERRRLKVHLIRPRYQPFTLTRDLSIVADQSSVRQTDKL